ncbi:MAG: Rrf2 family transcriptional regulator [Hespellia sp.]|nr:Rrf2 family transcriptional regulator [Hespellia sp.]
MKISTKGKYALEIIVDLAMHSDEEHLESLKNIAARRALSEKYLERIIKALKDAKLVRSVRGAYGGYCLAKSADKMTVTEVLNAVEGELAPVACLTQETDCGIDCDTCPTRDTWGQMWKQILSVTDSVTIADIVKEIT